MLLSLTAIVIGVVAVIMIGVARRHVAPARVAVGDRVRTIDGVAGTVLQRGELSVRLMPEEVVADIAVGGESLPAEPIWVDVEHIADVIYSSDDGQDVGSPVVVPGSEPRPTGGTNWFERLGETVVRARYVVAWGWLIMVLALAPLAGTAVNELSGGGLLPPGEAMDVRDEMPARFNLPVTTITVIADVPAAEMDALLAEALPRLADIPQVQGFLPAEPSIDGTASSVIFGFSASAEFTQDVIPQLEEELELAGISDVRMGGIPVLYHDTAVQTEQDLLRAEAIGIPIALIVLVLVFGTVVAGLLPVMVGVASVAVTLALIHVAALPMEMSIYVQSIASMLGLGIGIDYSLLSVSRFRSELAAGSSVEHAAVSTTVHAGRTATVSGVAVMAGMAGLAIIPMGVMHSIAIGGMLVVAVTVAANLTLVPALLAILGPRIDRLRVFKGSSSTDPVDPDAPRSAPTRWERVVRAVMRRPALSLISGTLVLLVLAAPVTMMVLDIGHSEILAEDSNFNIAKRELDERFGTPIAAPIFVVVESDSDATINTLMTSIDGLDRIDTVEKLATADGASVLSAITVEDREGGPEARAAVDDIRRVSAEVLPEEVPAVRMGGQAPGEIDFLDAINTGAPKVILFVFGATFLILMLAFRSIALPIKAVVLDTLSIAASLGVVVAVFQFGVGAGLVGAEPLGYTVAMLPIILFAILFGLSMDYEVFMLASIAERYQKGASNDEATVDGVASTAPLVTGAAAILIVIGIAFATASIVVVKQIGFALAVSLLLDATIVRVLMLPAAMKLMGDANWWVPERLGRVLPSGRWSH